MVTYGNRSLFCNRHNCSFVKTSLAHNRLSSDNTGSLIPVQLSRKMYYRNPPFEDGVIYFRSVVGNFFYTNQYYKLGSATTIEGRREGKRGRGRPRQTWVDDLRDWTGSK